MLDQNMFSYENAGTSSYLTVSLPEEAELVNYQLEMLISNEISHFLPVSRRMMNGEMVLYYNISSRTALSQILDRRKLKREELIQLIQGIVEAGMDAGEYQLPLSGLVIDPNYIYVNPTDCSPYFVYLPVNSEETEGEGVKSFLLNLVTQGKLELSSDNFIQVLLETVNRNPFSLEELGRCVKQSGRQQKTSTAGVRSERTGKVQTPYSQPVSGVAATPAAGNGVYGHQIAPVLQLPPVEPKPIESKPVEQKPVKPAKRMGARPDTKADKRAEKEARKAEKKAKKNDRKEPQATADHDGFDAEKAKKKFLLPQAVVMVVVAALVSFGVFQNPETGAIEVTNILAVVILIGLAEVILYREIYVNSKNPVSKKQKPDKKKDATAGKPSVPGRPPVPGRLPVPEKPSVPAAMTAPETLKAPERAAVPEKAASPVQQAVLSHPVYIPTPEEVSNSQDTELDQCALLTDNETEIMDGSYGDSVAYLEYYENGIMTRIPLDRPSILIGRLKDQVDFAVPNPKVGKIHAEFQVQNGNVFVKDLNSKNGTYINGSSQRIASNMAYPLQDRDRVLLADSEFTLRCSVK